MATITANSRNSFNDFKRSRASIYSPVAISSNNTRFNYNAAKPLRSTPSSRRPNALSKKMVVVFLLAVVSLVVVLFPATEAFGGKSLVSSERQGAVEKADQKEIIVQPGDTLWSIAKQLEPNKDPRIVVDQLSKARGTSNVYSGEKIIWSN